MARFRWFPVVPVGLLTIALLAGCISADEPGDGQDGQTDDVQGPTIYPPPESVEGMEILADLTLGNVNELTLRGDHAYVSGYSGTFIVDISDPGAPEVVAEIQCTGIHVRTIELEERLLMTLSSQADDNCDDAASTGGVRLIDVTDPMYPEVGRQVEMPFGSHTHTPWGDSGLIYNSAYNLYRNEPDDQQVDQHRRSEIINITDWQNPEIVDEFVFPADSTSIGCHDIWPEPERDRAICAAVTETQVWDVSDPLEPQILSIIRNPLLSIHHTATTTQDGDILILGDEWTGALGPGCFDGGTAPIGALWFYDISDDTQPELLSWFAPPHQGPEVPCTAHNFNIIEGHPVLVAAFFKAGTVLIDFSDPTQPTLIDQYRPNDTDVWASYYHNGHIFTGDRGRGMDVLMFSGQDHVHHEGLLDGLGLPNAS